MTSPAECTHNLNARFHAQDPDDDTTLPCIEVAGVQVYAYVADGELVVSLHYDDADSAIVTSSGTVPTRIIGGGGETLLAIR